MITLVLLLSFLLFASVILLPISVGVAAVAVDIAIAVGLIVGLVKLFKSKKKESRN